MQNHQKSGANANDELSALRLYFPFSARAPRSQFWHLFGAPNLGRHLLGKAKRAGIQQVLLHSVKAGFLPGGPLTQNHPETTPSRLPQCLELIDSESRLRAFMRDHAEELKHTRSVLFRCEIPAW